ncbi:jg9922 [Pararge aegeria aegeria]|uniref:Jg9922 protein n=1 Tax=Pararge aegeria aegeria TaxID=348720 RepID=A0A8S4RB17_9NEOP|nr:jg9922 [Pararge aegeria aegeria]
MVAIIQRRYSTAEHSTFIHTLDLKLGSGAEKTRYEYCYIRLGENRAAFEFKMRIIIVPFIKIPCAECKERPCFTRYNFAPKAGLAEAVVLYECRLGSNAAHGPLVDERTCTPYVRARRKLASGK